MVHELRQAHRYIEPTIHILRKRLSYGPMAYMLIFWLICISRRRKMDRQEHLEHLETIYIPNLLVNPHQTLAHLIGLNQVQTPTGDIVRPSMASILDRFRGATMPPGRTMELIVSSDMDGRRIQRSHIISRHLFHLTFKPFHRGRKQGKHWIY